MKYLFVNVFTISILLSCGVKNKFNMIKRNEDSIKTSKNNPVKNNYNIPKVNKKTFNWLKIKKGPSHEISSSSIIRFFELAILSPNELQNYTLASDIDEGFRSDQHYSCWVMIKHLSNTEYFVEENEILYNKAINALKDGIEYDRDRYNNNLNDDTIEHFENTIDVFKLLNKTGFRLKEKLKYKTIKGIRFTETSGKIGYRKKKYFNDPPEKNYHICYIENEIYTYLINRYFLFHNSLIYGYVKRNSSQLFMNFSQDLIKIIMDMQKI